MCVYIYIYILCSFRLWPFASNDCVFYHQFKTIIGFLCRQKLNFKFLIQLSEILPIKLSHLVYINMSQMDGYFFICKQ